MQTLKHNCYCKRKRMIRTPRSKSMKPTLLWWVPMQILKHNCITVNKREDDKDPQIQSMKPTEFSGAP